MKKNLLKFIPIFSLAMFSPLVAFAAGCDLSTLGGFVCKINELLGQILPVLIALGVIYFVWGMVQYFIADGEEAKKTGRDRIVYAVIGLAAIVGIWGLVNLIVVTFNLGQNANVPTLIPTTTGAGSGSGVGCDVPTDVSTFLGFLTCIIQNSVIPFIFALAVVTFVWGAVKFFIINADEEAKRAQGKQFMIWGIIALAVMISFWGLVNILGVTFGLPHGVLPQVKPGP